MSSPISIKGGRDGLRLQLDEGAAWEDLLSALQAQLERGSQFFSGAKIIVDIGERTLGDDQLSVVLDLMRRHGLEADALISSSRESRSAARTAGLNTRPVAVRQSEAEDRSNATVVQRTIRSGQVIRHQGHVTVIGDVNDGAEVIAGGSVIIWGHIRGIVHAGALGDRSAVICALDLRSAQLRIADLIARPPGDRTIHGPEMARVEENQISVSSWTPQKR
ncbi:MAG: septum site-determining protein MinC [Roseiflexaceae bacterium]|jgi:septum site-determining protein MinC